jgi:hypothetical protein
MLRKYIRQPEHTIRHVKEIHTSAMPSFVSMLTYEFAYHAFLCVHADVLTSLTCLLLCSCWRMDFFTMPSFVSMLTYEFRQHGHKRWHVKEIHMLAWTQKKACQGNSYVSIDTKEGMLKKFIRHLLCPCWRMNFLIMPSIVSMLTYEFL